jgi:RND family efflux transporter MFP subunit
MVWAAVLALPLAGCGDAQADASGADEEAAFVRIINVETTTVETGPFVEQIRMTGTVQANRDVTVSAEESGAVVEILAEKGREVAAGQPLARIDDRILRSQVDEARAQAALAGETWERRRRLWEEDRVGSELAYLEARYAAEQSAARLQNLEDRLARTVVRAPIEGMLEERLVEVGTLLSPGTPVGRIVDLTPVKVSGGVPERYALDVGRGARGTVTFDVLEGEAFEGMLSYVGSTVNARNRTFLVEFTLPNPGGVIKPEMVANVTVVRRILDEVVVVPQDALVRVAEGYVVFVVEGSAGAEVAAVRAVDLGPSQGNRVVIWQGLEPGERLVLVGHKQLAGGDRVRVVGGEG